MRTPPGNAKVSIDSLDAYGELLNRIQFATAIRGDGLEVTGGKVQAGPASVTFSGDYHHAKDSWDDGTAHLNIDSNGFPLASVSLVHRYEPELNAQFEVHGQATFRVAHDQVLPLKADGTLTFRRVTMSGVSFGSAAVTAFTQGQVIEAKLEGDLRNTQVNGSARIQIADGYPTQGSLHFAKIDFGNIFTLAGRTQPSSFSGSLRGDASLDGPLLDLSRCTGSLRIEDLQINPIVPATAKGSLTSADLMIRNLSPIVVELDHGSALVRRFKSAARTPPLTRRDLCP